MNIKTISEHNSFSSEICGTLTAWGAGRPSFQSRPLQLGAQVTRAFDNHGQLLIISPNVFDTNADDLRATRRQI
jgi:hypothetical protein